MSNFLTQAEIYQAMYDIASDIAAQYETALQTLPADAKTEKRALTVQREMATLCNRAPFPAFPMGVETLAPFTEKRFTSLATTRFPRAWEIYQAADAESRPLLLPYLFVQCFMQDQFLRPWRTELEQAKAAKETEAVFELNLKIHTILQVMDARDAWWLAANDRLSVVGSREDWCHG